MDITTVVVNWNSGPLLRRLIDSLQPHHDELEVIVVDNASKDDSLSGLDDYPRVQIVRLPSNLGFAGAANEGIRRSTTPFVLLLNPDVVLVDRSLLRLQDRIQSTPRAAIVCGPLIGFDGRPQNRFQLRPLPNLWSVLKDALFLDEILERFVPERPVWPPSRSPSCLAQPAAAFWLLRKQAWADLGGFDTRFQPAWFEDVDFCKRLRDSGWEIHFHAEAPALHQGGASLERLGYARFVSIYYRNLLRYWKKHHPRSYAPVWLSVQFGLTVRKGVIARWRDL